MGRWKAPHEVEYGFMASQLIRHPCNLAVVVCANQLSKQSILCAQQNQKLRETGIFGPWRSNR